MNFEFTKAHFGHADTWSNRPERYQTEILADLIHVFPPDTRSILDVGCGNGLITNHLPSSLRVVGLDSSPAALRTVTREPTLGDATNLPFADASFDVVLATDVLEHLPELTSTETVRELCRVAARLVIVTVPFMEDLHSAATKCSRCGILFHFNHHRRAYDLNGVGALPVTPGWTVAAQILTGDIWQREPAPIPMLRAMSGLQLSSGTGAICAGCGSTDIAPPIATHESNARFYSSLITSNCQPTRNAIELARTRTELMTVFARTDADTRSLLSRLRDSNTSPPRSDTQLLLSCDCTDPSLRATMLPLWPAEPFWWRDETHPTRTLVGFPLLDDIPRRLQLSGSADSAGTINCSAYENSSYRAHGSSSVARGPFQHTFEPTHAPSQFGLLFELSCSPGIRVTSAALDGSPVSRGVLRFEQPEGFWPLSLDQRLWLSLRRHDRRVPLDAWVRNPAETLSLRFVSRGSARDTTPSRGPRHSSEVATRPWRQPMLDLAAPSIRPTPPAPGRMGRFLALCHDSQIDRRIIQQIDALVDAGWTGVVISFASDQDDCVENHGPWLNHRIGLARIVPDDPLYWWRLDAQAFLSKTPRIGPFLLRALDRLYALFLNRILHRSIITYPLPFDLCFQESGRLYPADIIFCHDLPSLRAGRTLAESWRVPLVYDAHEFYPHQVSFTASQSRYCSRCERENIGAASEVLTVNESIAHYMADAYSIRTPCVVLNAVNRPSTNASSNNPIRSRLGLKESTRIVLLQGGLNPHRNLESFVGAARHLGSSGAALVLLGSGPIADKLRRMSENDGTYGTSFFMLAAVPPSELGLYARSADIGVIPYQAVDLNTRLCTPNKLFEYIAAQLPVVATDLPELRRFVHDTGFGVVGPTDTPMSLSATIRTLLDHPARLAACRDRIRRDGQRFSWEVEAHRFLLAVDRALLPEAPRHMLNSRDGSRTVSVGSK